MTYPIKLLLFSLGVSLLVFSWNIYVPAEYTNNHAHFVVIYFFLYSLLTHIMLVKSLSSEHKNEFTFRYMAATGIKLFISLIVIVVYAMTNKAGIIPFAILFIIIYFLFTGFEIISLLRKLKSK